MSVRDWVASALTVALVVTGAVVAVLIIRDMVRR